MTNLTIEIDVISLIKELTVNGLSRCDLVTKVFPIIAKDKDCKFLAELVEDLEYAMRYAANTALFDAYDSAFNYFSGALEAERELLEEKAKQYEAIRFWGESLGSFDYYIKHQQIKAAASNAPILAIYERDGEWQTLDQVKNERLISEAKAQGLL